MESILRRGMKVKEKVMEIAKWSSNEEEDDDDDPEDTHRV